MIHSIHLSDEQLQEALAFPVLIRELHQHLIESMTIPARQHLEIGSDTLLLMPAWNNRYIGVKMVTIFPENNTSGLPSIQGTYTLMSRTDGRILATMDAKLLTNLRTAATSALVAGKLARPDAQRLTMIGTGSLAPHLIRAHSSQLPIREVIIWGRSAEKAQNLVATLQDLPVNLQWSDGLESAIRGADVISTATMSPTPLVQGSWISPGAHIDAVGSYKPNLRELDDKLIRKCAIYVDTIEGATRESGDLAIPLHHGVIRKQQIRGTLFDLCAEKVAGRQHPEEITLFKSVGHASEDLIAASLAYEIITGNR